MTTMLREHRRTRALATWAGAALLALLVACGGSKSDEASNSPPPQDVPPTRSEAARFLTQASFGPTDAEIDRVMALGYSGWIDDQFRRPAHSHRATWEAADAAAKAIDPNSGAFQDGLINSFWQAAIAGNDQLRQRVAFALSQILVISMQADGLSDNPQAVAAYYDMLADKGLGTYRELLQAVSLHPMMGRYLSHLRNQKANAATGRVPDENYAREVMQLFSIGLHELNDDGTAKTNGTLPIETYSPADIAGLAKVFTGWSWDCPLYPSNTCFFNGSQNNQVYADRYWRPMVGYPNYHSTEAKAFLGTTIPAQSSADPNASLQAALDRIASHANVGPFLGRQLIQRLVTSNPSPAYVAAVAAKFNDNGAGVRGDMKAVVKAILLHPEARTVSANGGKVREPVLRLSAFMRAFGHRSDTGSYRVGNTDNPGTALAQTVLRSPTVFNFYRPGFVAPGSQAAAAGLVAPEMQIASETTAAGYVNYMRDAVSQGVGQFNGTVNGVALNRRDLQPDFAAELAIASDAAALVERMNTKLMYGTMPDALKTEIQGAVESIAIPALNSGGTNQAAIDTARRNRVNAAVFLTLVSPEFQTQK
jgi:uncharacterized protein (DUF1800 family)